jgi:hypothetical protein
VLTSVFSLLMVRNSRTHGSALELAQNADEFDKGQHILGAIMWPYGARTSDVPVPYECEMATGAFGYS